MKLERATGGAGPATSSPAKRELRQQGYLVPDQAAYQRQKARAARASALKVTAPASATATPTVSRKWQGIQDGTVAPSDSTSAVGPTRFIETINDRMAIYDRTHNAPISTATLRDFWGSGSGTTDPQILWDAQTKRFYYAGLDFTSPSANALMIGWSKTASPSSVADFCKYQVTYGTELPDYPKLGDSKDFAILGTNTFTNSSNTGTYAGSDILAIGKPPAGKTCPDAATIPFGQEQAVKDADGTTDAFTPEPANQVDVSKTGYVIANDGRVPSTALTLFKVVANSSGNPVIDTVGKTIKVSSYSPPANAPQKSTASVLDTLDGRLTQAQSAIDPTTGKVAIWTQHTVSGGAGAEVRWYEIDPAGKTVLQKGKATSASLFEFNGAIAPDRAVNGTTRTGGDSMVLGYDTSSSTTFPAIQAVSKVGANAQKSPVTVLTSSQSDNGFDCSPCRWGDYAAATPDPTPASGTAVWLTSMFAAPATVTGGSQWSTENFVVTP